MMRINLWLFVAIAALSLTGHADEYGWPCPVLKRNFTFPYGWSGEGAPPLSMDSKYAIVAMDAGLEYLHQWMKWNSNYSPSNYLSLVEKKLDNKLLSRSFFSGMYNKFKRLVESNYNYTHASGAMTNEVLAFVDNCEIAFYEDGNRYSVSVNDFRQIPPTYRLPLIDVGLSENIAAETISNAYEKILGVSPSIEYPWINYAEWNGSQVNLGQLVFADDYPYSWRLALDNYEDNWSNIGANAYTHILKDVFYGYVRHLHYAGANTPQMLMHCKSRTPYILYENEDEHTSITTYFIQVTTNENNVATVNTHYVDWECSSSNIFSRSSHISYGDKIKGETYACGSPYGATIELPMRKCFRGLFKKVFNIPGIGERNCTFYNVGYCVKEPRSFTAKVPFINRVKYYSIAKDKNYNNFTRLFPSATSEGDRGNAYTFLNYQCEGSDYNRGPVSSAYKGVMWGFSSTNNPYVASAEENLSIHDDTIDRMAYDLRWHPQIKVKYAEEIPTTEIHPLAPFGGEDLCLVTYMKSEDPDTPNQHYSVTVGWVSTNSWSFVEDKNAVWKGDAPSYAFTLSPTWKEVNGEIVYNITQPWKLPFHFYIDLFGSWISQRWCFWE